MKDITIPLINLICGSFVCFVGGFLVPFVLKELGINLI